MARQHLVGTAVAVYLCALVPALIASAGPPVSPLDRDLAAALSP